MTAVFLACLLLTGAPAVALEVTAVSSGTVVLDGCIRLQGLSLAKSDGRDYAVLPAYPKGRRGPLPADARLLSRSLHERLLAALHDGKTTPAACSMEVSVRSLERLGGSRHLADAAVGLDGELELVYGVFKAAGGALKVRPRSGFRIMNPSLEHSIERAVLAAYNAAPPAPNK